MKLELTLNIDDRIARLFRPRNVAIVLVALAVLGTTALVLAAPPKELVAGQVLSATTLNERVARAFLYHNPLDKAVSGYNIAKVEKLAAGHYKVTFAKPFLSNHYACTVSSMSGFAHLTSNGAESISLVIQNAAGAYLDVEFSLIVFADTANAG